MTKQQLGQKSCLNQSLQSGETGDVAGDKTVIALVTPMAGKGVDVS